MYSEIIYTPENVVKLVQFLLNISTCCTASSLFLLEITCCVIRTCFVVVHSV